MIVNDRDSDDVIINNDDSEENDDETTTAHTYHIKYVDYINWTIIFL